MLHRAGDYHVVGYGENINVPTIDIISTEINFIGNLVGSYNDLCDLMALAARGAHAARYLAEPGLHLSQITGLLGYAEQSALNRSCRRWFGKTPRQYRAEPTATVPT